MKVIHYSIAGVTDVYNPETEKIEQNNVLCPMTIPWTSENEERAKRDAFNGEYNIVDDGTEEIPSPSLETRVDTLEANSAEMAEALNMILSGVTE